MVETMSIYELRNIIGHKEPKVGKEPNGLLYLVLHKDGDVHPDGVQRNRFLCVREGEDAELMRLIYQIEEHGVGWKPIRVELTRAPWEVEDDLIVIDEAQMIQHRRKARQAINNRTPKRKNSMQERLEAYTLMGQEEGFGTW